MKNLRHAKREFLVAGYTPLDQEQEDGPNKWIQENVLALLEVFFRQGHSGSVAPYVVEVFRKLALYEPIAPLSGADDEWTEVSDGMFQNNRCSHVFKDKDRFNGQAYDINGRVFREPDGCCFTNRDSCVPVVFPYTPTCEYVDTNAGTYDTPPSLESLVEDNARLQNTLSLIRHFCAVYDIKETLRAPFTVGAHTYASNGCIAIRIPVLAGVEELSPDHFRADIASFRWPAKDAAWQPLPELPPHSGMCYHCKGTGRIRGCDECDGDGFITWETARHSYEAECKECVGSGKAGALSDQDGTRCPKCQGTGHGWEPSGLDIGVGHYQIALLTLIAALPSPEVAVDPEEKKCAGHPLWFRCHLPDGTAEGILMPYLKL